MKRKEIEKRGRDLDLRGAGDDVVRRGMELKCVVCGFVAGER